MRQCPRCKNPVEDNATSCNKCGLVFNNGQPRKPGQQNNGQNRPNQNMNNANRNPNQRPNQLQNRPNQNGQQRPNQNQNSMQNKGQQRPVQNNAQNNIDISNIKLSKAQEKAKDTAMMNAMKQAQASGNNFDINAFERKWIIENVVNKSAGTGTASSGTETTLFAWIIALLLSTIPVFNIVYSILCMKNTSFDNTRRNFHKAFLIFYVAMTIISIALTLVIRMI